MSNAAINGLIIGGLALVAVACGSADVADLDAAAEVATTARVETTSSTTEDSSTTAAPSTTTTSAPTTTTTEPPASTMPPGGPEPVDGAVDITGIESQRNEVEGGELVRTIVATDDDVFVLAARSQTLHQRLPNGGFGAGQTIGGPKVWSARAFGSSVYFAQNDGVSERQPDSGEIVAVHRTSSEAADVIVTPAGIVVVGFSESWVFDPAESAPRATLPAFGKHAVADGTDVWTVDQQGGLHRIDAVTGQSVTFSIPDIVRPDAPSTAAHPFPNLVVTDELVWVNGGSTELLGVDKQTGEIVERIEVGGHGEGDGTHVPPQRQLTAGFGSLYSTGPNGTVEIDLKTLETRTHDWPSAPIVTPDSLWVGSDDGLERIDPATGDVTDTVRGGFVGYDNLWAHGALWSSDQGANSVFEISWTAAE